MHSKRHAKDALYEEFAGVGKAIGNPKRFELLDLLSQGPRTVERLADEAAVSIGNVSHHLQSLKAARLVESRKDGLYVTYRLADGVNTLLSTVRGVAERHRAEVDRLYRAYFASDDAPEPQGKATLLQKVRDGEAFVIDVRPPEEYAAGHLDGALSIPIAELEKRLADIPADKDIVAYCRGRYCVLAIEAVECLTERGYGAVRLEESVQDFQELGFRIVTGEDAA